MKIPPVKIQNPHEGLIKFKKNSDQKAISRYLNGDLMLWSVRQKGISTLIQHSIIESLLTGGGRIMLTCPRLRMLYYTQEGLRAMMRTLPEEYQHRFTFTKTSIVDKWDSHNRVDSFSYEQIRDKFIGYSSHEPLRIIVEQFSYGTNVRHSDNFSQTLHDLKKRGFDVTIQFFDTADGGLGLVGNTVYPNLIYEIADFNYINVNYSGTTVTTTKSLNSVVRRLKDMEPRIEANGLNYYMEPIWYKVFNII